MAVFPLLADPSSYRACVTDLLADEQARRHWLDLFHDHIDVLLDAAVECGHSEEDCNRVRNDFRAHLRRLDAAPDMHGRLDILMLDEIRQILLCRHGVIDEFRDIKQRENDQSFAMLADWLAELDAIADPMRRTEQVLLGMLAGNIFDMGVKETSAVYAGDGLAFRDARQRVPARPWLHDDVEPVHRLLDDVSQGSVMIFIDNAGPDLVLGVLPLTRELIRRRTRVILAANARPSLNDVTIDELGPLLERAAAIDALFESPQLETVSSGGIAPLIDLSRVSLECAAAAACCDAVILVGMGRGIESNFHTPMTCPSVRIAMVKDTQVAETVGGRMYDAVVRVLESAPAR